MLQATGENYNYVFIRKDLPLCQQLVQASHASYEAGVKFQSKTPTHNYLIMCEVPNEEALLRIHEKLNRKDIDSYLFCEPDINNQATALCTEPLTVERRRRMPKCKLWKEIENVK